MKKIILGLTTFLFLSVFATAQSLVTPVFVYKDGDAGTVRLQWKQQGYYDRRKCQPDHRMDHVPDPGSGHVRDHKGHACLVHQSALCAGNFESICTDAPINMPENNVLLNYIVFNSSGSPDATISLGTADIEKVVLIDITSLLKTGTFNGIALTSDDGLKRCLQRKGRRC